MGPATWTALIASGVALIVGVLNFSNSRSQAKQQQAQFDAQQEQFERQLRSAIPALASLDNPDLAAITTIENLLHDPHHPKWRTFATIKLHVPDRTDDELRRLLRAAGGIQTSRNPERWRVGSRKSSPPAPRE